MAPVHLSFSEPFEPNIVALHIFEAPAASGPFTEIDTTTDIGTYPSYITSYTTEVADVVEDWFAIKWEDSEGALSPLSTPVRGGEDTLVGKVTDRVLQRDRSLDRAVVVQEAEGAIQEVLGVGVNPYTYDVDDVSYKTLNGIVYLVMARSYIFNEAVSNESVTIGLVTMRTGSSKNIDKLIALANAQLGTNTSRVLQMASVHRRRWHFEVLEP